MDIKTLENRFLQKTKAKVAHPGFLFKVQFKSL